MMKTRIYIAGLLLAMLPLRGYAYFEGMRPCTRAVGMGEAFTGVSDDANAIFYNPAGLGLLEKLQVPMNYTKLFGGLDLGGIYQTYFAVAGPVPGYEAYGSWGFSWYRRAADIVVNEDDDRTTTFNLLNENMIHLSWGRAMPLSFTIPKWNRKVDLKRLYAGLSVKIPFYRWGQDAALAGGPNSYFGDGYSHTGFGVDAALLYYVEKFKDMSLGVTAKDLLKTRIDLQDNGDVANDNVESSLAFGWSYLADGTPFKGLTWKRFRIPPFSVNGLRLAADAVFSMRKMTYHHLHFGAEKWSRAYEQDFAFRSGFKLGARDYMFYALGGSYRYFLPKPYGGLPFKYGFQFDYSFLLPLTGVHGTYGDHSITFTLLQGEKPDDRAPTATVTAPARFTPDEDGKDDTVPFMLKADDESGIGDWMLRISGNGKEVMTFGGTGAPPAQVVWDGRGSDRKTVVPNGTYVYVLTATDTEGNTAHTRAQNVEVAAAALEFAVEPAQPAFSPDKNGISDNMILGLKVDRRIKTVLWEVVITSLGADKGTVVRRIAGKGTPPAQTVWDGRGLGGTYVTSGPYSVILNGSDAAGTAYKSEIKTITVDLEGPQAELTVLPPVFSPDGDGNNDKTVFGMILRDPNGIERWELQVLAAGTTGVIMAGFKGAADAARTVEWDGKLKDGTICSDGTYPCRLTAYDKLGNRSVDSSGTVGIGNEDPMYRVFSPNNDGKFDKVDINVSPTSRPFDAVAVVFYGPDKAEVGRKILKRGTMKMTWAGTGVNGKVLPDAVYTYKCLFMNGGTQVDASLVKSIRIDTTPPDAAVFASPAAFTAIKGEKTKITLQVTDVSDIASWELEITSDDKAAFILRRGEGKPPAADEWDGRNEDSTITENGGKYGVMLAATDIVGNTGTSPMRALTLFGKQKILPIDPVQFELGKAVIKRESYPVLAEAAAILKESDRLPIAVYGHTDSQGDPARNLQLSQDRAQAVVDHFVETHGIARERFKEITGYGDTKPIADNGTREGRARNRRTEIKLLEEE